MKLFNTILLLGLAMVSTEAASTVVVCFKYENPLCTPQGFHKPRIHGVVKRSWDTDYPFDASRKCDYYREEKVCDSNGAVCIQPSYNNNKGGYWIYFANNRYWHPIQGWGRDECTGPLLV